MATRLAQMDGKEEAVMKPIFVIAAVGGLMISGVVVWRYRQLQSEAEGPARQQAPGPPVAGGPDQKQAEPLGRELGVAAGANTPIPQDTDQIEKHRREWLDWNRRTTVDAYNKVGKRDPKWDTEANEALEAASRVYSLPDYPPIGYEDVRKPARAAIDAGCDDPLIVYLYNRSLGGTLYPVTPGMRDSANALGASRYPAFRRALALSASFAQDGAETEAEVDSALALLTESFEGDERNEFWEGRWFKTLGNLINGYRSLGSAAPAAYQRVDEALAKIPELKVLRLQVRGEFWHRYGWEARTTAFAPAVPAGGAEAFEKC